jgi:glycosyltransferase involved in cell wall biosynthesis
VPTSSPIEDYLIPAPLLSFIVPSRNGGTYLESTILNLLDTPDKRFEVVLNLNNGLEVPQPSVDISDSRLKVYSSSKRLTMSENWWQGLRNSKGRWICYVGSDDGVVSGNMTKILDILEHAKDVDVVTTHNLAFHYAETNKSAWINQPEGNPTEKHTLVRWPIRLGFLFPQFTYDLPQPYNKAIVRKKLLESILRNETEIPGLAPDVFLGNFVAMLSIKGLFTDTLFTIRGNSNISNGSQINKADKMSPTTLENISDFSQKESPLIAEFGLTCRPAIALDHYIVCKKYITGTTTTNLFLARIWCNISCNDKSHHHPIWKRFIFLTRILNFIGMAARKVWFLKNFGSLKVPRDVKVYVSPDETIFSVSKHFHDSFR